MAYFIKGKVEAVMPVKTTVTKDGKNLYTREMVVKTYRFNPETGDPELSEWNTPKFEARDENCKLLERIKVGDDVKIQFSVNGVSYQDKTTNEKKYFTALRIIKLDVENRNIQETVNSPAPQQVPPNMQSAAPAQPSYGDMFNKNDAPF